MRNNISASKLTNCFLLLLLVTVSGNFVFAQGGGSPQQMIYQAMDIQVKTGMGPAFESFLKSDVIPAVRKIGTPMMLVFRTDNFGQAGLYTIVSPLQSMSELDQPDPLVQAIGEEGMAAMMAKLQPLAYEPILYEIVGRGDLGISPPNGYELKLALVVSVSIAPGRTEDYEKFVKGMIGILGKINNKGILAGKVGLGGNPNQYLFYSLFDSFADINAFGQAYSKAAAETQLLFPVGIVVHQEMAVKRYLPELSIMPTAPGASQ